MANEGLSKLSDNFPIVDWELERCPMQTDLLLQFRYLTQAMQGLDEATRGPVYVLDRNKAIDLRDALDAVLRRQ